MLNVIRMGQNISNQKKYQIPTPPTPVILKAIENPQNQQNNVLTKDDIKVAAIQPSFKVPKPGSIESIAVIQPAFKVPKPGSVESVESVESETQALKSAAKEAIAKADTALATFVAEDINVKNTGSVAASAAAKLLEIKEKRKKNHDLIFGLKLMKDEIDAKKDSDKANNIAEDVLFKKKLAAASAAASIKVAIEKLEAFIKIINSEKALEIKPTLDFYKSKLSSLSTNSISNFGMPTLDLKFWCILLLIIAAVVGYFIYSKKKPTSFSFNKQIAAFGRKIKSIKRM